MGKRQTAQELRGSGWDELAPRLPDLLSVPALEHIPETLMDLLALADLEEMPLEVGGTVKDFEERSKREVGGIPEGDDWNVFLDEYVKRAPEGIPIAFRKILRGETERRTGPDRQRCVDMLERWAMTEPAAFLIAGVSTDEEDGEGTETSRIPRADDLEDKDEYLELLCMERLGSVSGSGLSELVLVAGLHRRASERFPDVRRQDIQTTLRTLRERGVVRVERGRWKAHW
jgi:hypothetical protein